MSMRGDCTAPVGLSPSDGASVRSKRAVSAVPSAAASSKKRRAARTETQIVDEAKQEVAKRRVVNASVGDIAECEICGQSSEVFSAR